MKTIHIASANNKLAPPKDWPKNVTKPYDLLFVRAIRYKDDGLPRLQTAWLPSPEDLERLKQGLPIIISLITEAMHPAMTVHVGTVLDLTPTFGLPGGAKLPPKPANED